MNFNTVFIGQWILLHLVLTAPLMYWAIKRHSPLQTRIKFFMAICFLVPGLGHLGLLVALLLEERDKRAQAV